MTQTRALTGSARRTGSPLGTRTTLVAQPLVMASNAIPETSFESRLWFGVFTLDVPLNQLLNLVYGHRSDRLGDALYRIHFET